MKLSTAVLLLGLAALALRRADAQSCATGYIRVCVTPLACACVLPSGGTGDPVMRDFTGKKFEFFGSPGSHYNLYSDVTHQVNMGLFAGFVDGHNGSYMGAFGVSFQNLRVNVTLVLDGDISVEAWEEGAGTSGRHSVLASGEATQRLVGTQGSSLVVSTEPYREWHGRVVDLRTGGVEMAVWSVPAGTKDSKGVEQPAYLNFNLTLLTPPAGDVAEGIIGESLHRAVETQAKKAANLFAESTLGVEAADVFNGKGMTNDYRVSSLFASDFEFSRFGQRPAVAVTRRAMLESRFARLDYPLMSTTA